MCGLLLFATGANASGDNESAGAEPILEHPAANSAIYWYIQSARQGYASSQFQLGKM